MTRVKGGASHGERWPRPRSICAGSNAPCRHCARKALTRLTAGDLLIVECTDPLTEIDIPNLVRETGDAIEATAHRDDAIVFHIRKR